MLDATHRQWQREGYMISTEHSLLDPSAINEVLSSDMIYWANGLAREELTRMLKNSLCFGLYALPKSTSEIAGRSNPPLIGFARIVTDEVTIAYLTDVYVLKEHQGKGLGGWLIDCVHETLESWPMLRRTMLLTSSERSIQFYRERMGMTLFEGGKSGVSIMMKKGKASPMDS